MSSIIENTGSSSTVIEASPLPVDGAITPVPSEPSVADSSAGSTVADKEAVVDSKKVKSDALAEGEASVESADSPGHKVWYVRMKR